MPEPTGYRLVDARRDGAVCGVIAFRGGRCHRFVFRFGAKEHRRHCRVESEVEPGTANLATLGSGVAVAAGESGGLEIFSARLGRSDIRQVRRESPLGLFREGNVAMGAAGETAYQIRMV
ncbi:MAG: hypothetical protein ACLFTV_10250 [Desulfococcaceae bacterium]